MQMVSLAVKKRVEKKQKGEALFVLVCVFEGRHNNNKKKEKRGELREERKKRKEMVSLRCG